MAFCAFIPGRLPRWPFQLILASTLVTILPACQSLRLATVQRPDSSRAITCLERARSAWQVMQEESPGTITAQKALRSYNHSVKYLVKSLPGHEGTATWGREIRFGGARP